MATIAYVGLPAHGHTNPALAVMKALLARGHRVLFYNADSFRERVGAVGLDFRPFPEPMPTESEISRAMRSMIDASLILSRMSAPLARFLVGEFERERPDLVIYDSVAMWGYVAARAQAIPTACFITTFVLDGSIGAIGAADLARFALSTVRHLPELVRWKRGIVREFGADNAGGLTEYADLNIVFTSREFHPPNGKLDSRFRFVGPALDPATRERDFPYERLAESTRVYVSLGTINHLNTSFYRAAFEAFAGYPAQFILSAGMNTDIAALGSAPDNFIVRPSVPQLDILQRVDAFVTHGGMNSVHEGLTYGAPLVVVPQQIEQLLNGRRVAQTGSGILLDRRPVTAEALRASVDAVLTDPRYRTNAEHMGQTLRNAGGTERAAAEIEVYLARGSGAAWPIRAGQMLEAG